MVDLAKMTFVDFIKSPMGSDLYRMLSLDCQPTQDEWAQHQQWWEESHEKLRIELKKRSAFDEFHEFVAWRSQLFMAKYWDLVSKSITNVTGVALEQLIWDAQLLRSLLLELGLDKENSNEKTRTKFQRIIGLRK